ncbi:MAG: hypothetical protein LBU51_08355 [Bacteroidales bacterium]|jgi:hypothetical protein|nr:hypothetical protein [Bacteroidales bacterium]
MSITEELQVIKNKFRRNKLKRIVLIGGINRVFREYGFKFHDTKRIYGYLDKKQITKKLPEGYKYYRIKE